jgi:uncharacterized protein YprB with RNaseH-like and TPR domain
MPEPEEIYLDIETDWYRRLTVVGFFARSTGVVQIIGRDITAERVTGLLPAVGTLYTFNGHSFDLPCIRTQPGLDLRTAYNSVDLRFVCARRGLKGGQKAVEKRLGVRRDLPDLDGRDAVRLWSRFQQGDREALGVLLHYNREDLQGLVAIRQLVCSG